MTQLSGALREIQHCTDDHGGDPSYQERIDRVIEETCALALRNARPFGEDVIAIVQQETALAGSIFEHQRTGAAQSDQLRRLQRIRAERIAVLKRLAAHAEFPPAPGSLRTTNG